MGRLNRPRRGESPEETVAPALRTLFVLLAVENLVLSYTSTAMNVALTALVEDLDTSLTGVEAAISLFSLVVAASLITGSKLGARHGFRRIFALGGEIYTAGALITAFGPSLPFVLLGWSLLQGLGVALMLPALLAILTAAFSGATRTRALSVLGMIGGIGGAAGPVVGGLLTGLLTWRVSFLLEALITAVVLLLLRRTAGPQEPPVRPEQRFDVLGSVLSAAGFGLLVVALLLAGQYGLLKAREDFVVLGHTLLHRGQVSPVPLLVGAALVVLAAFAGWERHLVRNGRDPLVRLSVLRNRTVRTATETQVMQYMVPYGVTFLVPVYLQTTLGFGALQSGVLLLATTLGLTVSAPVAAKLIGGGRMTHRAAQMGAFLFMTAGCVAVGYMLDPYERGVPATGLALAPGLFLLGLGQGLATTVLDLIQSAPPPEEVSDVTGLSRTAAYLGCSLGVALAGTFMTATLLLSFEDGVDASTVLSADQKQLVVTTLEGQVRISAASDDDMRAKLASQGVTGAAADELVRINAEARGQALTVAATGTALLGIGGFLVARRLPRERTGARPGDAGGSPQPA